MLFSIRLFIFIQDMQDKIYIKLTLSRLEACPTKKYLTGQALLVQGLPTRLLPLLRAGPSFVGQTGFLPVFLPVLQLFLVYDNQSQFCEAFHVKFCHYRDFLWITARRCQVILLYTSRFVGQIPRFQDKHLFQDKSKSILLALSFTLPFY